MAKINMRDYYPFYEHDEFVEVSDELAAEMAQWERTESTANYSFTGIEICCCSMHLCHYAYSWSVA